MLSQTIAYIVVQICTKLVRCSEDDPRFEIGIHLMKQFAHNCHLQKNFTIYPLYEIILYASSGYKLSNEESLMPRIDLLLWPVWRKSRHCEDISVQLINSTLPNITAKTAVILSSHDDVIKWKHFPRYWPFVQGIHRSPVNSPHKSQWHRALMFSLICAE